MKIFNVVKRIREEVERVSSKHFNVFPCGDSLLLTTFSHDYTSQVLLKKENLSELISLLEEAQYQLKNLEK